MNTDYAIIGIVLVASAYAIKVLLAAMTGAYGAMLQSLTTQNSSQQKQIDALRIKHEDCERKLAVLSGRCPVLRNEPQHNLISIEDCDYASQQKGK